MTKNMGSVDRGVRAGLGLAIIVAGVLLGSWWGLVGIVFLGTAAVGTCPAYLPFGLRTCPRRESTET